MTLDHDFALYGGRQQGRASTQIDALNARRKQHPNGKAVICRLAPTEGFQYIDIPTYQEAGVVTKEEMLELYGTSPVMVVVDEMRERNKEKAAKLKILIEPL